MTQQPPAVVVVALNVRTKMAQAFMFGAVMAVLCIVTFKDLFSLNTQAKAQGEFSTGMYGKKSFAAPAVEFLFW